jgi:hypothetical protein
MTPTGGVPLSATAREGERGREGSARGWARETLRPRKEREKRGAGLRGSWTEARPTRKGKEGERGVSSGWPRKKRREERKPKGEGRVGRRGPCGKREGKGRAGPG